MENLTFKKLVSPTDYNAATLAGLLERIKKYVALIGEEAAFLELKAAGVVVNENSNLEQIAEAMLSILKYDASDVAAKGGTQAKDEDEKLIQKVVLDAGQTTTIPVGYNTAAITVASTSLSDLSQGTATAGTILEGKTAWVNGEKITGTIPVRTTYAYDAEVVTSTDSEGNETAEVKTVKIDKGYYDQDIIVTPIFKDLGERETVINTTTLNVNKSGEFNPHDESYDYYTGVTVALAQIAGTAAEGDLNIADHTVTVKVTTPGWTDSASYNVVLPTKTAPSAVDAEASSKTAAVTVTPNVTGALTVTVPAGLYSADTVIKVNAMDSVESLKDSNVSIKDTPTFNEDTNKYTVTVTVDLSGYIEAGDYVASDLDIATVDYTNVTDNVITANTVVVSNTEGYVKDGDLAKTLTVRNASEITAANITSAKVVGEGTTTKTITITPETAGWYTGSTVELTDAKIATLVGALTDVETLTYKSENTSTGIAIENATNATVAAASGSFYNEVNLSSLLSEMAAV